LTLKYSGDGGNTWIPCGTVTGDIANQNAGNNKLIIWNNEVDNIRWGLLEFRVEAPRPIVNGCTVNTSDGKQLTFMCYNLGANPNLTIEQQMAYTSTSNTDATVYGDLYQWGRPTDGHEKRTSGTTATLATTNTPGHSNFILAPNSPYDWRSGGGQLARWGDGTQNAVMPKAADDPCPAGWRMPTQKEWASIYGATSGNTWTWNSTGTPGYKITPSGSSEPTLFLPAAGSRLNSDGTLRGVGSIGFYWSSTVNGAYSYGLNFASSLVNPSSGSNTYRAYGLSCRCVSE
jgi:uncharacterized protein (TIGR02145 family)